MANYTNHSGQLDLSTIYGGLGNNSHTDRISDIINPNYQIPSLEQIAAYNQAVTSYGGPPTITPGEPSRATEEALTTPNLQQMYSPITQQDIEETPTPATTIGPESTVGTATGEMPMLITDFSNPYPVTSESIQFLNGFIRTQIGRRVSVDFLVGSNTMITKTGYLLGVATNYILLNELDTDDITACDFYNVKFIRFYY